MMSSGVSVSGGVVKLKFHPKDWIKGVLPKPGAIRRCIDNGLSKLNDVLVRIELWDRVFPKLLKTMTLASLALLTLLGLGAAQPVRPTLPESYTAVSPLDPVISHIIGLPTAPVQLFSPCPFSLVQATLVS